MGCGSACTLWVSFPGSGLGLAAPSISFLFLSCAARVLSTVAHEKLHLGNKQPLADTAETLCTPFHSPGSASLLSMLNLPLQRGLYLHRNPCTGPWACIHTGASQKILRMSQQMQLQELDAPGPPGSVHCLTSFGVRHRQLESHPAQCDASSTWGAGSSYGVSGKPLLVWASP